MGKKSGWERKEEVMDAGMRRGTDYIETERLV